MTAPRAGPNAGGTVLGEGRLSAAAVRHARWCPPLPGDLLPRLGGPCTGQGVPGDSASQRPPALPDGGSQGCRSEESLVVEYATTQGADADAQEYCGIRANGRTRSGNSHDEDGTRRNEGRRFWCPKRAWTGSPQAWSRETVNTIWTR